MSSDLNIPFDRITYRDGQLLTARDLRDDQRRHARLRRLHTRYSHETWGIALGFEVSQTDGNRAVAVGPGYAVDSMGRDTLLAETIQFPVPNVVGAEPFVLTLSYQEDAAFRDRRDLAALCLSGGLDPRQERPVFSWRRPDEVRFGPQVPLVQIVVANGTIQGSLDFRVRHYTQPLVRPHFGAGATEPGRTGWNEWQEGEQSLGLEVTINTSEVGFTAAPYCFVVLQGDFSNRAGEPLLVQSDAWSTATTPASFPDALSFITRVTAESFTYRLLHTGPLLFERAVEAAEAEERQWRIFWLGLQPVSGCEPDSNPARFFTWAGFPVQTLAAVFQTNEG